MDTPELILRKFDTIAVVGLSRDPHKSAHSVPAALQKAGFRIVPVNPHGSGELLGEHVYARLSDIPFPVDVVLVFRPSAEAPAVAQQAVTVKAKALWLQLGIFSEEAERIAEESGLLYVEDQCAAVERSLHGITKKR
jgi:predicted CoA-binding protein